MEYRSLKRPLLFTIIYCGFNPCISSQKNDSAESRLKKIKNLIKNSKYSIHDLSRMEASKKGDLARFNMPFELGIDTGCKAFGKNWHSKKQFLIFDEKQYRYQKAISDMAGCDINHHSKDAEQLIIKTRSWFFNKVGRKQLKNGQYIWELYNEFITHLEDSCTKNHTPTLDQLADDEYIKYATKWISVR